MSKAKIGIIGCGNIAGTYGTMMPLFNNAEITACADINMDAAKAFAEEYKISAMTVDDILASDVDLIINLTIPAVHAEITNTILNAGKHVYSEKPLGISVAEGMEILETAKKTGKRVGCSPDTFLGGCPQQARQLVDDNAIGKITSGTCHVMGPGMEMWHPNPDFFFQPGGGPVLDLGPYYIGLLINLLGPVKRLGAMANKGRETRTITSEPRNGEVIPVDIPTTLHATLEFAMGAIITLNASWDVWAHTHKNPVELYGTEGSLFLPDPNWFGGQISMAGTDGDIKPVDIWQHPLGKANLPHKGTEYANYRSAGIVDMMDAEKTGREHRCSLERTLHAVEIMTGIVDSSASGEFITLKTTCTRPEPLSSEEAKSWMH